MELDVIAERCSGCGECVAVCPMQVFVMVNGRSERKNPEECLKCDTCLALCPSGAIVRKEPVLAGR